MEDSSGWSEVFPIARWLIGFLRFWRQLVAVKGRQALAVPRVTVRFGQPSRRPALESDLPLPDTGSGTA
jgi:hypothetical protein